MLNSAVDLWAGSSIRESFFFLLVLPMPFSAEFFSGIDWNGMESDHPEVDLRWQTQPFSFHNLITAIDVHRCHHSSDWKRMEHGIHIHTEGLIALDLLRYRN